MHEEELLAGQENKQIYHVFTPKHLFSSKLVSRFLQLFITDMRLTFLYSKANFHEFNISLKTSSKMKRDCEMIPNSRQRLQYP